MIAGGFAFTQKGSGTTDNHFFDEDDVSLKQRKNNLCRRLREERNKEKKKASKPVNGGTVSVTQNQAPAAAMAQSDSFDDEILGLPGLDGLEEEGLNGAFDEEIRKG